MEKRPVSLTIIAWIIIISALFNLYTALTMQSNPVAASFLAQSPLPASVHMLEKAVSIILISVGLNTRPYLSW